MTLKRRALVALLLIAPAPSVGVVAGLFLDEATLLGRGVWLLAKVWLFALPAVWHLRIDRQRLRISRPTARSLLTGALSGLLIGGFILGVFWIWGAQIIDPQLLRARIEPLGLADVKIYLALCAYIVVVNALLEEYVYRWFVFRQAEAAVGGRVGVLVAAGIFTIHHVIILAAYFPAVLVAIGSLGVFVGGATWSVLYLRYRSIWPAYLSHAIVDIAVLTVGYLLIFE